MSQSLSQIWIHLVFSTNERFPFLRNTDIRHQLYKYIKTISHHHGCHIISIGGIEDHIHILTTLNKNISLATFVREIKNASSTWIKKYDHIDPYLAKFYWQKGYGVFSVSQSNVSIVKEYIQNQHEHHKKIDFKSELIKLLNRHD